MKISDKQKTFCVEYVKDFNGTQAAIRAGYSRKTANEQASRLLAKVSIQQELDRWRERIEKETLLTIDQIINELCIIAFSTIEDYLEIADKGVMTLKNLEDVPEKARRAIESISEGRAASKNSAGSKILAYKFRLKLYNKVKALELLCKFKGLLKDRVSREDEIPDYLRINCPDPCLT